MHFLNYLRITYLGTRFSSLFCFAHRNRPAKQTERALRRRQTEETQGGNYRPVPFAISCSLREYGSVKITYPTALQLLFCVVITIFFFVVGYARLSMLQGITRVQ